MPGSLERHLRSRQGAGDPQQTSGWSVGSDCPDTTSQIFEAQGRVRACQSPPSMHWQRGRQAIASLNPRAGARTQANFQVAGDAYSHQYWGKLERASCVQGHLQPTFVSKAGDKSS
eukprot:4043331-Amphidinium_carterae.1